MLPLILQTGVTLDRQSACCWKTLPLSDRETWLFTLVSPLEWRGKPMVSSPRGPGKVNVHARLRLTALCDWVSGVRRVLTCTPSYVSTWHQGPWGGECGDWWVWGVFLQTTQDTHTIVFLIAGCLTRGCSWPWAANGPACQSQKILPDTLATSRHLGTNLWIEKGRNYTTIWYLLNFFWNHSKRWVENLLVGHCCRLQMIISSFHPTPPPIHQSHFQSNSTKSCMVLFKLYVRHICLHFCNRLFRNLNINVFTSLPVSVRNLLFLLTSYSYTGLFPTKVHNSNRFNSMSINRWWE